MFKFILYFVVAAWMAGCDDIKHHPDFSKYTKTSGVTESCINGVVYYTGGCSRTLAIAPDGGVYLC